MERFILKFLSVILLCLPVHIWAQAGQKDFNDVDAFAQQIGFSSDYFSIVEKIQDRFIEDELIARAIFSWIVEHISYNQQVLDEFNPHYALENLLQLEIPLK